MQAPLTEPAENAAVSSESMDAKRNPLVSVLISAYNHEPFVEKAIESVMTQTYRPIELLVVDDGSSDKTLKAVQRAHERWDGKFFYETQANRGVSPTLNDLIRRSSGRYVCLFSSDDWMLPDKTKIQVEYMEEHPEVGMVYSNSLVYEQSTDSLHPHEWVKKTHPSGWIFRDLLEKNFIPAASNLIKRDCLDQVGLLDETSPVSDWDLWLKIAQQFPIHYLDSPTAVYRVHGNNSANFMPMKLLEGERRLFSKHCQDPCLLARHLKRITLHELSYYSIRDREVARRMLTESCRYWYTPLYLKSALKFAIFSLVQAFPRKLKFTRP
jgi:alpha-1,3-rhamnosyltransferase